MYDFHHYPFWNWWRSLGFEPKYIPEDHRIHLRLLTALAFRPIDCRVAFPIAHISSGARDGGRTRTPPHSKRRILSPLCLPISPPGHISNSQVSRRVRTLFSVAISPSFRYTRVMNHSSQNKTQVRRDCSHARLLQTPWVTTLKYPCVTYCFCLTPRRSSTISRRSGYFLQIIAQLRNFLRALLIFIIYVYLFFHSNTKFKMELTSLCSEFRNTEHAIKTRMMQINIVVLLTNLSQNLDSELSATI